jgi:NADP-dependent 3-hydroxy acid dehydrogenase YdfG
MHREPTVSLEGYRILVTGGTTGIGRATALELATRGAHVLIGGTDPQHLEDALESFSHVSGEVEGVLADLGTKEGVLELFAAVDEQLGGLDIAILNAGIAESGPLIEMSHDVCHEIVNVNLNGYISCSLESLKRLKDGGGQIILIGSMSAEECGKNSATYVASKSGIRGFSKSLRKEANPLGIRVSLIEPGKVGTDMQEETPAEQEKAEQELTMLTSEDIARSVMFVLEQPDRCDIVMLQVRPRLQEI